MVQSSCIEHILPDFNAFIGGQFDATLELVHSIPAGDEVPAPNFQATVADSQLRIGARLGEDLLELFTVELDVVESELGGKEVA